MTLTDEALATVESLPISHAQGSGRTAMARTALSRPVALALNDGLIPFGSSFFDYGCGRGGDIQRLKLLGYEATGWDPAHFVDGQFESSDVVNLGYVANVIENPEERGEALRRAWELAKNVLIVAARMDWEATRLEGRAYGDGIVTSKGSFQKLFTQEELRAWIDTILGVRSVAASLGIFYIFRDDLGIQALLASRVRRRPIAAQRTKVSEILYERNRDILDPLTSFIESRGRVPELWELPEVASVRERFRTVKAALSIVRRVAGDETWHTARALATDDLTVYLALAAFGGRPKYGGLPPDVQLDVKAFFGSYKEACEVADAQLYRAGNRIDLDQACQESLVGKLTPAALYVHIGALDRLAPLLRIYEGCARALTGTVENATIVKLNRIEPKVSYLIYPDFDRDPHPSLTMSVRADLRRLDVRIREYGSWSSPPILHRKETFVAPEYPGREKFARLTSREERIGLLSNPATIGNRESWLALVTGHELYFRGHRLMRKPKEP
jgi:DNA phosphorothioation-associated putative methyltransferase